MEITKYIDLKTQEQRETVDTSRSINIIYTLTISK